MSVVSTIRGLRNMRLADDDDGAAATLLRRAAPHSFISDLTEPETGYDTTGCESTTT